MLALMILLYNHFKYYKDIFTSFIFTVPLDLLRVSVFSSVQFSYSVVSDSLWPQELQHARPTCPSPTPRVHPNPCPLSRWCHPTISSSVVPFSSCPQSFPASGPFLMSQLFTSGGQSIEVSASTSVLPMNTHNWSCLGWTDWLSLAVEWCLIWRREEIVEDSYWGLLCFFP